MFKKIKNFIKKRSEAPNWAVRTAMAGCWATINSVTSTHDEKIASWNYLTANVKEAVKER